MKVENPFNLGGSGSPDDIPQPSLRRFFSRFIKMSFSELRIWNTEIMEYICDMLTRFSRTDALYRIRHPEDRRLELVVEMLLEASQSSDVTDESFNPSREWEIRRHIGDYTLFMTGIFRENVEKRSILDFYMAEGKRSYLSAAQINRVLYMPGAHLLEALSRDFEHIAGALNYMKKVHLQPQAHEGQYRVLAENLTQW